METRILVGSILLCCIQPKGLGLVAARYPKPLPAMVTSWSLLSPVHPGIRFASFITSPGVCPLPVNKDLLPGAGEKMGEQPVPVPTRQGQPCPSAGAGSFPPGAAGCEGMVGR